MPHPEWPAEPSPWDPDRAAEPSSLWDPNSGRPAAPIPTQPDAAARNVADATSANGSGSTTETAGKPSAIRPYVLGGASDTTVVDAPATDADAGRDTDADAGTAADAATDTDAATDADAATDTDAATDADVATATDDTEVEDDAEVEGDAKDGIGADADTTADVAKVEEADTTPADTKPADGAPEAKPADGAPEAKPADGAPGAKPAGDAPGKKPKGLKPPAGYIPHGNYPPAPDRRGRPLVIALTIVIVILMLSTAGVAYLLNAKSSDYDKQVALIGQRNTAIATYRTKINQLNTQLQQVTSQVQLLQQQLNTQTGQLTAAQAQVVSLQQCIRSFNNLLNLVAQNASKTDINTAAKQIDTTCGSNLSG